jgi:UDP-N-acetylglucosamine 2-epimerase
MKIVSVVGARPEFIQATPVSRALRPAHQEILVHTGQHYDYLMSQTFFDELGIPAPDYNLEVGSGSHAGQTAEILVRFLANRALARQKSTVLSRLQLAPGKYGLVTIHRAANTDEPARLTNIVTALSRVGETVVFPVHPRTSAALQRLDIQYDDNVRLIEPVSYYDMMVLEENARMIATDSGGVQREAYFMRRPCITLREETEWMQTVQVGWNKLVGVDVDCIVSEWKSFSPPAEQPPIFGDGTAGEKIAKILGQIQLSVH